MIPKQAIPTPTVAHVSSYLQTFLPTLPNDVKYIYHQPLRPSFSPTSIRISSLVFSITPSPSFYDALHAGAKVGFLHRPFNLIRRNVTRMATILASHKAFDEVLTVGFNLHLATQLGMNIDRAVTIQGYKGDPARRIGIVAPFTQPMLKAQALAQVLDEFHHQIEGHFGFDNGTETNGSSGDEIIAGVAIMNAFHADEVDRALSAAISSGILTGEEEADKLLYLTGAVREPGLVYAREKRIRVICVGHRQCEEWGVRFLAKKVREEFPGLQVVEVMEDEQQAELKPRSKS